MSRKEKMKVYHGIPKSVTDEHTIFYASLDGTQYSSDGSYLELGTGYFNNMPTGYGYKFNGDSSARINNSYIDATQGTIDLFVNFDDYIKNTAGNAFVSLEDVSGYRVLEVRISDSGKDVMFRIFKDNFDRPKGEVLFRPNEWRGIHHLRATWSLNNYMRLYIDGILVGTSSNVYTSDICINTPKTIVIGNGRYTGQSGSGVYAHKGTLADIHISNIDRGDYFPNLPQDFIDGKAIVKPRMGQQQIKGDPMYSQVTEVVIPPTRTSLDGWANDPNWIKNDSNSAILKNNPEITTNNSNFHDPSSQFKIKGLNGEIISGVIDTDTALAKVTKVISPSKYVLNTIQGLSAEDTIRFYISTSSSPECTIKEVDVTTNTITLNTALSGWEVLPHYYVIETTASSSSPIVKTQDGTTVVGTWSGLGTNEATFTLGENADISGKDLYVTYALTMPLGNSDFPELPHTIERAWGENGVEMKPVNEIVIVDDFRGKISGSLKECPHIAKANAFTSLMTPNEAGWTEWSNYSKFIQLDNDAQSASTTLNGHIPMQLFSFNLIEMVERKLGCEIPSSDKYQWLKENYDYIEVRYTGYGANPTGNLVKITIFDHLTNLWVRDWLSITTSSPSTKHGAFRGTDNFNHIIPNGVLYVLAYTDPSDGVTTSVVCTDYISVEIKLKVDSTFTTLYCENTRAREDKCNPILIQKETKTVKRYLPSKECFVTECGTNVSRSIPTITSNKVAIRSDFAYFTSQGTGSYNSSDDYYKNCIAKLGIPNIKPYNFINDPLDNGIAFGDVRFAKDVVQTASGNNEWTATLTTKGEKNHLALVPHLYFKSDLSLCLGVIYRELINGSFTSNKGYIYYDIPNRPLMK